MVSFASQCFSVVYVSVLKMLACVATSCPITPSYIVHCMHAWLLPWPVSLLHNTHVPTTPINDQCSQELLLIFSVALKISIPNLFLSFSIFNNYASTVKRNFGIWTDSILSFFPFKASMHSYLRHNIILLHAVYSILIINKYRVVSVFCMQIFH